MLDCWQRNVEWIWQNISTWYLLNHLLHVRVCVCVYAKLENLIPRVLALFLLTHILSVSPAVGTVAVTIAGHNLQSLHLKHINSMRISILELQNPSSSSWMLLYLTNQFCVFHFSLVFVLFAECTHITISIYCIFFVFFVVVGFFCFLFSGAYMQIHLVGLFFCAFLVFLHSIVWSKVICRCPFNLIYTKYTLTKSAVLHTWNDVAAVIAIAIAIAFASTVVDVVVVASFSAYY